MKKNFFLGIFITCCLVCLQVCAQKQELRRMAKWNFSHAFTSQGMEIRRIDPGGTFEKLGFKTNDVITEMNGITVVGNQNAILNILNTKREGDSLYVRILRKDTAYNLAGRIVGLSKVTSANHDVVYDWTPFKDGKLRTIVRKPRGAGRFPVILYIPEFPCWVTDAFQKGNYEKLAQAWVAQGYAVVYVEKTGLGDNDNTPPCESADLNLDIENYAAGIQYIKGLSYIDPAALYLYGHGMGGIVAAKLAGMYPVRGTMVFGTSFRKWSSLWMDRLRMHAYWNQRDMVLTEKNLRDLEPVFHRFFADREDAAKIASDPAAKKLMQYAMNYDAREGTIMGRSPRYWQTIDSVNVPELWSKVNGYVLSIAGGSDSEQPFAVESDMIAETVNSVHPGAARSVLVAGTDHTFNKTSGTMMELFRYNNRNGFADTVATVTTAWLHTTATAYQTPVIVIPRDTSFVDLKAMATTITQGKNTTEEKVRAIINWANKNMEWTATDYVIRTPKEILCRRGGNCNEEKKVVAALFAQIGIQTRTIREINIQPENKRRQNDAETLVQSRGPAMSVFGLRHNDHVWIEYYDSENQKWEPADPTTGLVGLQEWIRSRVGFDERPMHSVIASKDMLVPIFISVFNDQTGEMIENRSEHYLIASFNEVYGSRLSGLALWDTWQKDITAISPKAMGAFRGQVNLHEYANDIKTIYEHYLALKQAYKGLK